MSDEGRVAVIADGSHGLGFETARRLAERGVIVILASADGLVGKAAADKLQSEGLNVRFHPLDMTRSDGILRLRQWLAANLGRLDILIKHPESQTSEAPQGILDIELETLRERIESSAFGALRLTQELLPLMESGGWGRIVHVGASAGQLNHMGSDHAAHRLDTAVLHALTAMIGAATAQGPVRVNAVDPNISATPNERLIDRDAMAEASESIVRAALMPEHGPSGRLLRAGEVIEW
jgi:NAD(P)-dependent dehydrogenase (short-subunit alcohol dehydrogenase family)